MLLDGSVTKQEAINDCLTYWNPNRTQTWFDMGIDIIIGKREGYYFWDMDGKKYMNLHLNGGTFNLGHRNPEVIAALEEGVKEFDIGNHHFGSVARGKLAKRVCSTPSFPAAAARRSMWRSRVCVMRQNAVRSYLCRNVTTVIPDWHSLPAIHFSRMHFCAMVPTSTMSRCR